MFLIINFECKNGKSIPPPLLYFLHAIEKRNDKNEQNLYHSSIGTNVVNDSRQLLDLEH